MSKYKKSQADLKNSEATRNDMQAKTIILENDTTQYGIKVRSLHNDISYLESIGKSETDKLSSETEKQRQMLNDTRSELASVNEKLSKANWQLSRPGVISDSLQTLLTDSLKLLIDEKKITIEKDGNKIKINLIENGWFTKEAPFLAEETRQILDEVIVLAKKDSSSRIEIERTGTEPAKSVKTSDGKWEYPILGKSYQMWNYISEKSGLRGDSVKLVNVFSKTVGGKDSYSIVLRR